MQVFLLEVENHLFWISRQKSCRQYLHTFGAKTFGQTKYFCKIKGDALLSVNSITIVITEIHVTKTDQYCQKLRNIVCIQCIRML